MTNFNSNEVPRTDGQPANGPTHRNGPTPAATAVGGQDVSRTSASASSAHANPSAPSPVRTVGSPPDSASARPTAGTPGTPTSGPRDDASRNPSGRFEGMSESVNCLIQCVEQLVREIPRGPAARFEGVNAELRKARTALDRRVGASSTSTEAGRSSDSRNPHDLKAASRGTQSPAGSAAGGPSRSRTPDEDAPSDSPAPAATF